MANDLYVTLLGDFSMTWPERDGPGIVSGQGRSPQQLWTFMAYLCTNRRRPVEEAELIRALWDEGRAVDPAGTLKMLLERARSALEELGFPEGRSVLLCRRGVYSWVPGLEIHLDTEEMELLSANFSAEPEKYLPEVLKFLPRCGEGFLPDAARTTWVSAQRTRYRGRYLMLLRSTAERLGQLKRYEEAIRTCRTAAELDPFDEETQIMLMRLLHQSGATQSALWHYKSVSKQYIDHLGIAPSARMSACYQEIAQAGRMEEPDLQAVRTRLEDADDLVRPMYCEYPVFQGIYQLTARSMLRTGAIAQLALLTVLERDGLPPSVTRCGAAMETLKRDGLSSLREGDVCTRFSPNQYLLLLPSSTEEDARTTLSRCLTAFEKTRIGQSVVVQAGVTPVEPIEL